LNKIEVIRYSLQALILTVGSVAILFFGLMGPIVLWFNPFLGVGSFIFAGAIAYGTVEIVDLIDTRCDRAYIIA
jgi:hypothetical protein